MQKRRWTFVSAAGILGFTGSAMMMGGPAIQAATPVTISLWTSDIPQWTPFYEQLAADFEKTHPGIHVVFNNIGSGYTQKLTAAFAAGTGPDVWVQWDSRDMFTQGFMEPLNSFIAKSHWNMNQYFQPITSMRTSGYDGKIYALPRDYSADCIFYNKTLFEKDHVPLPTANWTWAQFARDAKLLTNPKQHIYGTDMASSDWMVEGMPFLWDMGSDAISPNGWVAKGYLNSPQMVQLMTYAQQLNKNGSSMPPSVLSTFGNGYYPDFVAGQVAMTVGATWGEEALTHLPFQWATAPVPLPPGTKKTYAWQDTVMFSMNARSHHKTAAWELMEFLAGPKTAAIEGKPGGHWAPDVKEAWVANGLNTNPHYSAMWQAQKLDTKVADYERNDAWYTAVEPYLSQTYSNIATPFHKPYPSVAKIKVMLNQLAAKVQKELNVARRQQNIR